MLITILVVILGVYWGAKTLKAAGGNEVNGALVYAMVNFFIFVASAHLIGFLGSQVLKGVITESKSVPAVFTLLGILAAVQVGVGWALSGGFIKYAETMTRGQHDAPETAPGESPEENSLTDK